MYVTAYHYISWYSDKKLEDELNILRKLVYMMFVIPLLPSVTDAWRTGIQCSGQDHVWLWSQGTFQAKLWRFALQILPVGAPHAGKKRNHLAFASKGIGLERNRTAEMVLMSRGDCLSLPGLRTAFMFLISHCVMVRPRLIQCESDRCEPDFQSQKHLKGRWPWLTYQTQAGNNSPRL